MTTRTTRILTLNGTAGDDVLVPRFDRAARVFGFAGNDRIRGSLFDDLLDGGDGDDFIDGQIGSGTQDTDTLLGGRGNDRIIASNFDIVDGGAGSDTVELAAFIENFGRTANSPSRDVVSSGSTDSGGTLTLSSGASLTSVENLVLRLFTGNDRIATGSSNDTISAGAGNDTIRTLGGSDFLFGDAGSDFLDGGAGNDRLLGGAGLDTLVGGTGADIFVLDQFGGGLDRILDFNLSEGDRFDAFLSLEVNDGDQLNLRDPFAAGQARITDTPEGALVEAFLGGASFNAALGFDDPAFQPIALFVGVSVAQLGSDFLI